MNLNNSNIQNKLQTITPHSYQKRSNSKTAVVFLILTPEQSPHLITIQKKDRHGYPWRNQIALPGGHLEPTDQTLLDAAYREVEEELDISRDEIIFQSTLGFFPTIRNIDIKVFTGILSKKQNYKPDPAEIEQVIEVPLSQLCQTHLKKNFSNRIPTLEELTYPISNPQGTYTIWGVTARIIHYFLENL